jgi:acetoin utilization protein AcuB
MTVATRPIPSSDVLRGLSARDIMTAAPCTVSPETRLSSVTELMETRGIQHFPVLDEGRLVGMLSEACLRDAMPSVLTVGDQDARRRFLRVTKVSQVAAPHPHAMGADTPLAQLIGTMRAFRLGAIPITDGRQLVGIVTSGDLITLLEVILKSSEEWAA